MPGYRVSARPARPIDAAFLERAWSSIAAAASKAGLAVVLGTERRTGDARLLTALVIDRDGAIAGFQDKVQLDPSEEGSLFGRLREADLPNRAAQVRGGDLPRRLAVPGNRPMGRAARGARRVPPPFRRRRAQGMTNPPLPTPRIHSMRRQCCAVRRRTPAILRA